MRPPNIAALALPAALILASASFRPSGSPAGELPIGSPAPAADLALTDTEGKNVTLTGLRGDNGLLVVFSCNTCPWVIKWEDRYNGLHELCRENGIGMVAVNSNEAQRAAADSPESMKQHAEAAGYTFPYVLDRNSLLADAFGATKTPHVFLFDKDMKLVYRGAIDNNAGKDAEVKTENYLDNAITALAGGKKIDPATTRSLGCSIKRVKS